MAIFLTAVYFVLGLGLMVAGAEVFVKGAARIAVAAGISRLVVGLTVVAFGTSAPELLVSVTAALKGTPDLAVGNVVGSNIFNVLLILGLCAVITPINVARQFLRVDTGLMIAISILLLILSLDGSLSLMDGLVLFGGFIAYTAVTVIASRKSIAAGNGEEETSDKTPPHMARDLTLLILGLVFLVVGSRLFVQAAITTAQTLGASELIIGLTIVAAGTSLPELATSAVAAMRGQRDIAVGNIIGSNIFNILGVLGMTALVSPAGIPVAPSVLTFDLPVMIAVALACFPIFLSHHRIDRWEGAVFLFYYGAYTAYLILQAQHHDLLQPFSLTMIWFVTPVTTLTLLVILWQTIRNRQRRIQDSQTEQ